MSQKYAPRDTSPSVIASGWLDRQLVDVLADFRRRLRKQVFLASAGIAVISGGSAFTLEFMSSNAGAWHISGAVDAAMLAMATSAVIAAALYPVLQQRNLSLMRAMSIITHGNIDILSILGKLTELRSGETSGHNLRVTLYTLMFAEALRLPPEEIVRTVKGALLHDVGKLAVPDAILAKPGPLMPEEREEMQLHVRYGLEIISQSIVLQDAALVVGDHHERFDGCGYPRGLKGTAIPREARLFALVDVFDALTSQRVYKPALGIDEALATMAAGRGAHFDPLLLDSFIKLAPDLVHCLPQSEAALTLLLMERLIPYREHFLPERSIQDIFSLGSVSASNLLAREKSPGPWAATKIPTTITGKGKV